MKPNEILLVEDEPLIREYLRFTVKEWGWVIGREASTGEEAVRAAAESDPAVILMDVSLEGGMSGIDAARIISKRSDAPILFISAYRESEIEQRAGFPVYTAFIQKPIREDELRTAMDRARAVRAPAR